MNPEILNEVIEKHATWLRGESSGQHANLWGVQ